MDDVNCIVIGKHYICAYYLKAMRMVYDYIQYSSCNKKMKNLTHNTEIERTGTKSTLHDFVYIKHKNKQY